MPSVQTDGMGRHQTIVFLTELGLYRLLGMSRVARSDHGGCGGGGGGGAATNNVITQLQEGPSLCGFATSSLVAALHSLWQLFCHG